jgi:hypothetical protein
MRSNATCTTCIHAVKMSAGKVLDLLLATDDAAAWHDSNMRLNPHHYSRLARLAGPTRVAALADSAGGVYYNTHVVVAGRLIKYGVASTQTLVNDLNRWDRFYLAGRLQKPVKLLRCSPEVRASERASERVCVRARMTVAAILVADVLTIMGEVLVAVVGVIIPLTPSVRVWRACCRSRFQPTVFMCAMFTHVHTAYSSHNRR